MNYKNICIFAGTTEGRMLVEILTENDINITVCVATEYGEVLIDKRYNITINTGRLDSQQMIELFNVNQFDIIIDTTHPFAIEVTDNIIEAATATQIEYLRLLRDSSDSTYGKYFSDIKSAAEYLSTTHGNILLTTGSKELQQFCIINNYNERIYPRVLPLDSSLDICKQLGYNPSHIIAMQGPFNEEINTAMIKMYDIKYLVTKESGTVGGFIEKLNAAYNTGIECIIIGRPPQVTGYSFNEIIQKLNIGIKKEISIIGVGIGRSDLLTIAANRKLRECDIIIGAKRVVETCNIYNKPHKDIFLSNDIIEFIANSSYQKYAIVMSGDIGFYSGARKLIDELPCAELVCGISSPVYMAAKLGIPWENMKLCSLHARECNLLHYVKTNFRTFALIGGKYNVQYIIDSLRSIDCKIYVGERLSYDDERISIAVDGCEYDNLSSVIIENPNPITPTSIGDDEFIRSNKIPMTKSEIRTLSVAKLKLESDSIIYDIGAGTGSVTIEIANAAYDGKVYAIEKKHEAVELIHANIKKFKTDNITVIEGTAPDILSDLPSPTHAFIGGTSGSMADIIDSLIGKNSDIRIVINAITLETISEVLCCAKKFINVEIVNVSVAKSKIIGNYNMMTGQNPVYIICLENYNG